jgi:hypothetical protein
MKKSSHHKIGGCSGTRYGCCPNSNVSKVNHNGTNCHNHNRRPDSRIQYIGYHPRQFYPVNREPIIRQEIIRQPIIRQEIIRQPTGSNQSDNSELFHIFNLILVLIVLMFSILMAVRFLK